MRVWGLVSVQGLVQGLGCSVESAQFRVRAVFALRGLGFGRVGSRKGPVFAGITRFSVQQ